MSKSRDVDFVHELLAAPRDEIDRFLAAIVEGLSLPAILTDAIAYALLDGGKRLRPILAYVCGEAAGGDGAQTLPAGAAVELIHAFSLVHDDLPAMDNDTLRRGKPTLHIHAGEALAILAGDAMLALAFDVIRKSSLPDATRARLIGELADGTMGMIAGQVHDTLGGFGPDQSELERLRQIHWQKTGALIRASCRMGVIAVGGTENALEAVTGYAESIGLMYQIVDDLLDVEQPTEHTGKRTGKDGQAGKLTYPGVLGVEESRVEIQRLTDEAAAFARSLGPSTSTLISLLEYLGGRTR
ncbi:MAG: polyprenyl synthetase family protein [Phycisphaeraceae bacterium]|nr:polyprenyl synthetase family protein [Phycisphaeraceae bacterium]MCW5763234.1 polyprenyl synthetase family protein [Phycisphaeraceae bacterium]